MSTVADMEVKVGADISELLNSMGRAGKSLQDFKDQLSRFKSTLDKASDPASIIRLNRAIEATNTRIKSISSAGIPKAFSGLASSSNSAGFALQNLGRVAQDVPFGFIGIQNNLNPLLESFTRLKAETGSSKAALQALGSSLIGPAGLGIALSLASSAFLIYQNGIAGFNSKTKEAKEKADEFANAVKSIFKEAAQEAAQVQSLIVILNSEVESRKRKLEALQELKKIQPEIFNGLKLEGNAVVGLDAAYQKYIQNLKTVIAVKIKQQQLEKVTEQILEKEGATMTRQQRSLKEGTDKFLEMQRAKQKDASNPFVRSEDKKRADGQKEINDLYKDQKFLLDEIGELSKGIKLQPVKEVKIKPEKIIIDKPQKVEFAKGITEEFTDKPIHFDNAVEPLAGALPTDRKDPSIDPYQLFLNQLVIMDLRMQDTAKIATDVLSPAFDSFFDALGNGDDAFNAFGQALGETIKKLTLTLLKAVALGAVIAAITGKPFNLQAILTTSLGVKGFANGVQNFSGGIALVGERGPELVNLPKGSDVIPNGRFQGMGGGQTVNIVGHSVTRGSDIYTVWEREGSRRGRNG